MNQPNLIRTSAFRLTVLYVVLFCASVIALFVFVYWSTMAFFEHQTKQTIDAEIRGLAEQYSEQGLGRLIAVIAERSGERGNNDNVYLLTDPALNHLAGNLTSWPENTTGGGQWVELGLNKWIDGQLVTHQVLARTFDLHGGFHLLVGRDTHEGVRFRTNLIEALAWSLTATIGLGILGGIFMSRRMLGRVEAITRTTQRIMKGDLSDRIDHGGSRDEFDRLAGSLNAMLDQIERLMTGMRLATDSIAHDLRGPLTRIRGRIELALRRPADNALDRETLGAALAQVEAAITMFDSLLKIAQAEAGIDAAELQPLRLDEVVDDTAELYAPVAEDKGIRWEVETGEKAVVNGQRELLAQSVANLLDNAVRHTPAGGRITIAVTRASEAAMLVVADSGPGIPEAERERVFERFVRLDDSRTDPGAGLGLSLVAAVARLHEATVTVHDNDPGLRVVIRFPAADQAIK